MNKLEFLPFDPVFLETLFAWRNQPSTVKHNPIQPISIEEFENKCVAIGSDLSELAERERFRWYLKLDEKLVGHVGFVNNHTMMTAEIGYVVDEQLHGRGIATQAIRDLVAKVFKETKIRKLTAGVSDKNVGSIRVLEKVGFVREGLLREQFLINSLAVDEIAFGLLRHEWLNTAL